MQILAWGFLIVLTTLIALLVAALRAHKAELMRARSNGCTCDSCLLGLKLNPECPIHRDHYIQTLGKFKAGDFVYTCYYDFPAFVIMPFLPDPLEEGSQQVHYQVLYYGVPEHLANIKNMQEAYQNLGSYADRVMPRGFEFCLIESVSESDIFTPREHARLRKMIQHAERSRQTQ